MACLIFGNSEIVLGFWRCVCLRKPNLDLLEALYGLFKAIKIEFTPAFAEDDLGNKILGRQIADKTMVLLPV